jgi:hypothetical protein
MTASNRELAARAQAIAKGADGLQRTAANSVSVALAYSPSTKVAREALEALGRSDVRRAALELLDELTAADSTG